VSLAAAAIDFVGSHPTVATIVLGGQNLAEVKQDLAATIRCAPVGALNTLIQQ